MIELHWHCVSYKLVKYLQSNFNNHNENREEKKKHDKNN